MAAFAPFSWKSTTKSTWIY